MRCIDWSRVILDLRGRGLSVNDIAAACGYTAFRRGSEDDGGKRWVQRLANIPGTQPDFHHGALLIGLWAEQMGADVADVPRTEYRFVRNSMGRIVALPLVDVPAGQHLVTEAMPNEP